MPAKCAWYAACGSKPQRGGGQLALYPRGPAPHTRYWTAPVSTRITPTRPQDDVPDDSDTGSAPAEGAVVPPTLVPELTEAERRQAAKRLSVSAAVVHEVVRDEGECEEMSGRALLRLVDSEPPLGEGLRAQGTDERDAHRARGHPSAAPAPRDAAGGQAHGVEERRGKPS